LNSLPLRDGKGVATVNWFEFKIVDAKAKRTCSNSVVTSIDVDETNVVELADCGRALWQAARKILAARYRFFDHIRTIVCHMIFPDWGT